MCPVLNITCSTETIKRKLLKIKALLWKQNGNECSMFLQQNAAISNTTGIS